ncbi:hypothetical protein AHMF7605_03945 [Adhaeribacter arboris]|uniref:Uncharacterized protein n=1 Tax=Adhaeribacter arboris TaxID=2072846 RepID=A0A2T2YB52_9BACT|nr:hypothetical protein AHMF7605_03945 [Adhaeribacter arboris]
MGFSGSPFFQIIIFVLIAIGAFFLKIYLNQIKETNPKLAYTIIAGILIFSLVCLIIEFS